MRRAVIDATGVVVNVVALPVGWTGRAGQWQVPAGHTVRASTAASPGDTWDGQAYQRPTPERPRRLDPRDFWKLFTQAEQLAILDSQTASVRLVRADLQTAKYVERGHPETNAGIAILESAGLLTVSRARALRAFESPA